jgi:heme-degrading monooxygenase HmoA
MSGCSCLPRRHRSPLSSPCFATGGAGTARLTKDLSEPGRYLSFADWESVDQMQAWKNNPGFGEHVGPVQAHVSEFTPSEMELVAEV